MELFAANKQWATRPKDERFPTLQALYEVTKAYADKAVEKDGQYGDIRVDVQDGDVRLVGRQGIAARISHWAFGQLAVGIGAPAKYLRELPATLAAQNLNHGLAQRGKEEVAKLLFHKGEDSILLRAITSEKYARIWNWEVAERLVGMSEQGWKPAMPTMWKTDDDFPSLYASDHDMFAFITMDTRTIQEAGSDLPLRRGVIVKNSEVGGGSLSLTRFMYREMCGNHIIWGASEVKDVSLRHVGSVREKWGVFAVQARAWADESASDDEVKIARAKTTLIADTKENVLDALFGKRALNLSRKAIEGGFDATVPEEDGDPCTVWGFVQGLTRYSQGEGFADERTRLDTAAGKVMDLF